VITCRLFRFVFRDGLSFFFFFLNLLLKKEKKIREVNFFELLIYLI